MKTSPSFTAELTRRDFTRTIPLLVACLMATRVKLLGADAPIVLTPELTEQLLRDTLRQSLRGDYDKSVRAIRALSDLQNGLTTDYANAARALDAAGRRAVTKLASQICDQRQTALSGISDFIGLFHLDANQRGPLIRSGYIDAITEDIIGRMADQAVRGSLGEDVKKIAGWIEAIPSLQHLNDPRALLGMASSTLRYFERNAHAIATDKIETSARKLEREIRHRFDDTKTRQADQELEAATRLRDELVDAQQTIAVCRPLLIALGVSPAEADKAQQFANAALSVAVFIAGGPFTLTGALTMLDSFSGLFGGGGSSGSSDGTAAAIAAMSARIEARLAQILDQLQHMDAKLDQIAADLAAFSRISADQQQQLLNSVHASANSLEVLLDRLIAKENLDDWLKLRADTAKVLHNIRSYPVRKDVSDYIIEAYQKGPAMAQLSTTSVTANAFSLDAAKILQNDLNDLRLNCRCECLASIPNDFPTIAFAGKAKGRAANPIVWLQYVNGLCDVAFLADAHEVLPFNSDEARSLYLYAYRDLVECGKAAGEWFRALGSKAYGHAIANTLDKLLRSPSTFDWLHAALLKPEEKLKSDDIKAWYLGYDGVEVYNVSNRLPAWNELTGTWYHAPLESWYRVEDDPLSFAQKVGLIRLNTTHVAMETRLSPAAQSHEEGAFHVPRPPFRTPIATTTYTIELQKLPWDDETSDYDDQREWLSSFSLTREEETSGRYTLWRSATDQPLLLLFDRLTRMINRHQSLIVNAHLSQIVRNATAALTEPENTTKEWVRTAMLGNLALSVHYWRQGLYGIESPNAAALRVGAGGPGGFFGRLTPFACGHDADVPFTPQFVADGSKDWFDAAHDKYYGMQVVSTENGLAVSGTLEPVDPRWYHYSTRKMPSYALNTANYVRDAVVAALKAKVEDYREAFTDIGDATIPPIEVGLAKLAALRAAAGIN